MPATAPPPPERKWNVGLRNGDRFIVRASYVQRGLTSAMSTDGEPYVLKDSEHKAVLVVPGDWLSYIERQLPATPESVFVPLPAEGAWTPALIRDLQRELEKVTAGSGRRIIVLPPGSEIPEGPPDDPTGVPAA